MPFVVPVASKARRIRLHCSLCAWVAQSHRSLQAHQRTEHSNAFRCTSCSKTFSDVEAVRRHSRSTRHQISNVHTNSDEVVVASADDAPVVTEPPHEPEESSEGEVTIEVVELWELEKCKCPEGTPPMRKLVAGEKTLRCSQCCRPARGPSTD